MNISHITAGGQIYGVWSETPPAPEAQAHRALVRARLVDELTGLGIGAGVSVTSAVAGLVARVSADGVAGLAVNPARRFTDLAANAATIALDFAAPGYLPHRAEVTLGPINTGAGAPADFPDHFAALDLGDIALRRDPVWISGRVLQEVGASRTPLAGVTVEIAGIWRHEPAHDDDPDLLVEAADILSLSPGLYRDRPGATNTLRDRTVILGAASKRIVGPVDRGALRLQLSDRIGLAVGALLALDPANPETREFIAIDAIAGGLDPAEPAEVTLAYPMARARRAGAAAAPAAPGPGPGLAEAFDRDGGPGDRTAYLDAIQPTIAHLGTVEIAGDGQPEYQTAGLYRTTTDGQGNYRLPALSRVARLRLSADRFDFAQPLLLNVGPDYRARRQSLDFVHRP